MLYMNVFNQSLRKLVLHFGPIKPKNYARGHKNMHTHTHIGSLYGLSLSLFFHLSGQEL